MGPALSSALGELDHKAKIRSAAAVQHFHDFCMRQDRNIRHTSARWGSDGILVRSGRQGAEPDNVPCSP
jgi:hypothetical protein